MIWFMQIKYISIIPASMCMCANEMHFIQMFYPSIAPGYYPCQTRPIIDLIFIKFDIHKVTETGTKW